MAQLLKRLRISAGLTQEELAEAAGISTRSVSDQERGIYRTARKDTRRLIADALGLSGADREHFMATASGGDPTAEHEAAMEVRRLPAAVTPLVGRDDDVQAVTSLLRRPGVRLVTVTGLGGVGKTRAAIEAARQLGADFPGGVFFADLSAVRDSELVTTHIARAAGVRMSGQGSIAGQVAADLGTSRALVLADNFEQVIKAATVISALLAECPGVKFLVTSRRVLRIGGEYEYPLAPLRLPTSGRLSDLIRSPAVELFAQRAQAAMPGWRFDEQTAPIVAEICRRLDGLPLALELAAARMKLLPPAALLERLAGSRDVLSLGPRDSADRHRTLQTTLDWSYNLLDPVAARLFPRLSVFAGDWTLDVLVEVCGVGTESETLDAFAELVDNSLVWRVSQPAGYRFTLPITIHDYADRMLRASGDYDGVARRHLRWCLDLAEASEAGLSGVDHQSWLRTLTEEYANLAAALDYAIMARDSDTGHRLAAALWRFWEINGHLTEGRQWLARVLALDSPASPTVRARTLKAAGNLARDQGDLDVAMAYHRHAHELFTAAGDRLGIAAVLNNMGAIELDRGDSGTAVAHFQASLDHFTAINDQWGTARALGNLAHALRASGQPDGAKLAQRYARMSVQAFERLGDMDGTARSLATFALILGHSGQHAEAIRLHARAATIRAQCGDLTGLARSLENIAWSRSNLGDFPVAARLLGYAETLREESGVAHTSDDRLEYDGAITQLLTALEPDELRSLISEGRQTTRDEVMSSLNVEAGYRA
jgi:predicted ATPase/transcriptional regulator with XRE-family HTH domain